MPRGDRTGPNGQGPMTGRRLGFCTGNDVPGFMETGIGFRGGGRFRAFGRGFGHGFGRGRGFGWRVPIQPLVQPSVQLTTTQAINQEQEKQLLEQDRQDIKDEIEILKQEMKNIEQRLKEIKDTDKKE
jgi:hypothetical protein